MSFPRRRESRIKFAFDKYDIVFIITRMKKVPVIIFIHGLLKPFNVVYEQWVYRIGKPDKEGRSLHSAIPIIPHVSTSAKKTPEISPIISRKEG